MTDDADVPAVEDLVQWIINQAGGIPALSRSTGVAGHTLKAWRRGRFPRVRLSTAVEEIERWARQEFGSRYPPEEFPPQGLLFYCRTTAQDETSTDPAELDTPRVSTDATEGHAQAENPPPTVGAESRWRRRPGRIVVGVVVTAGVVTMGIVIGLAIGDQNRAPRSATIVVANKVALRTDRYVEDVTPAYLSTEPTKRCKQRRCALPGTDMNSGHVLTALCHLHGDQMTNYDTNSGAYGTNPDAYYSDEWYRAAWPDGRTGYIAYVYIAAQYRSGMGLGTC